MRRFAWRLRPLCTWTVTGLVFDAATVIGVWTVLNTAGPLNGMLEAWLCAVGLMIVPWYVHVVALPAVFRVVGTPDVALPALLVRGLLFVMFAAALIPFLGVAAVLSFGLLLAVIQRSGALGFLAAPYAWIDRLAGEAFFLLLAAIVGAAVGALLHIVRAGDLVSHPGPPHKPGARSDIFGGAIAAFLLFGGIYVALLLDLFDRSAGVPPHPMRNLAVAPQLVSSVLIVAVAMLPHLLMVGEDFFRSDRRSIGPSAGGSPATERSNGPCGL